MTARKMFPILMVLALCAAAWGQVRGDEAPKPDAEATRALEERLSKAALEPQPEGMKKGDKKKGRESAEEVAALREAVLKHFDADKDGRLNETERAALEVQMELIKTGDEPKWLLERFDADKDGMLNAAEREKAKTTFEALRYQAAEEAAQAKKKMLERFDENKDGELSVAEQAKAKEAAEKFKALDGEAKKRLLKRFDENGDGKLDESERAKMLEAMEKRGEKKAKGEK